MFDIPNYGGSFVSSWNFLFNENKIINACYVLFFFRIHPPCACFPGVQPGKIKATSTLWFDCFFFIWSVINRDLAAESHHRDLDKRSLKMLETAEALSKIFISLLSKSKKASLKFSMSILTPLWIRREDIGSVENFVNSGTLSVLRYRMIEI